MNTMRVSTFTAMAAGHIRDFLLHAIRNRSNPDDIELQYVAEHHFSHECEWPESSLALIPIVLAALREEIEETGRLALLSPTCDVCGTTHRVTGNENWQRCRPCWALEAACGNDSGLAADLIARGRDLSEQDFTSWARTPQVGAP